MPTLGQRIFAPPCGTSSKARERPLPKGMEMIRAEPLRSPSCLLGVSGLKDLDAKRVAAANKLYALTLCLVCILVCRGAAVSVEKSSQLIFLGYHEHVGTATFLVETCLGISP